MSVSKKASPDVTFDPEAEIAPGRALVPAVMKLNEQRVEQGFWPRPTPGGVPVVMMSPGSSVMNCEQ